MNTRSPSLIRLQISITPNDGNERTLSFKVISTAFRVMPKEPT